ncbi:hypothetical protein [Streptomyces violaceusniger]|uniref:hypothetical protein n=1 Tax=Streptomyces violaceusniger TaxID=68280 RepID=UPI0009975F26|nr:hypothetical protein [Streptomyces hygroscopicus]AQW46837.1 hypothetical protein SHXM_00300 [Streptomyces hygroscopicus]
MTSLGRKAVVVMAAALASVGVGSGAIASATSLPAASCSGGADCSALAPVNMAASQGSLNVTQMQLENISATVVDAVTGQPVRGVQVHFYAAGGRLLGTAYTNYSGIAAIAASENLGPGTVQELLAGYEAVLLGDGVHTPASAHGAITVGDDFVPLGSLLFSDRTLKRDVVPVDWSR